MNNISQYIIEKLHLNKDLVNYNFTDGDTIMCISITVNDTFKESQLKIYEPFTFKKIDDKNKFTYINGSGSPVTQEVFINSNNYYESTFKSIDNKLKGIFIPLSEAIYILEGLINNTFRKKSLKDYFDKNDDDLFKYPLNDLFSIDGDIPKLLKYYKKRKK